MTGEPTRGDNEVELRRERFLPRLGRALLIGTFGALLGYISTGFQRTLIPILAPIAAYWVTLAVFMLVADWLRYRNGTLTLRFADDGLYVPGRFGPSCMGKLRYEDIRAANEFGRGWLTSFAIDAGERLYAVPIARLSEDGVARLMALLQSRMENLPDGAARWTRIAMLRTRAAELRMRPAWATRAVAAVVVVVFLLQLAWLRFGAMPDGFGALDMGANAAGLVERGQWWRLVTGNLLHASPQHLVSNVLFLLVFGTLLERIAGVRVFLVVLLATGVAAQAVSAVLTSHFGRYLYAVGVSGALTGLVGALGALTLLHWRDMPAGFRITRQRWVALLGLNVMIALGVTQPVDHAAHAGGLVAGLVVGWLMTTRGTGGARASLTDLTIPGPVARWALAGLLLLWVGGVAAQAVHASSAASRLSDRVALVRDQLPRPRAGALVLNALAYAVAENPAARTADLRDAQQLAGIALARVMADKNASRYRAAVYDTVAVLDDRLGQTDRALRIEALLLPRSYPAIAAHLAAMLERRAAGAPILIGTGVAAPTLRLQDGTLRFNAPTKVAQGGRVIAFLRRDGAVRGLVNLYVPPDYDGETVLPLPTQYGGPVEDPPDAMWLDGRSSIEVAWFDSTGCRCRWPSMAPEWHELPHGAAVLP